MDGWKDWKTTYTLMNWIEIRIRQKSSLGAFHSTKISENSGSKSNGTENFRKIFSKILVNLSRLSSFAGNSEIPEIFRSIRAFLPGPSFSEPGNRNSTWLILKLLSIILVLYQTNDWNILLPRYCSGLASQWNVSITARVNSLLVIRNWLKNWSGK